MTRKLDIYVINLDRSKKRLADFHALNGHLTDVVRFSAIDGHELNIQSLVANGLVTANILETFSISTVGCAMSHVALWDTAIETNTPIIVCEDDAIFNHGFEACADQVIRSLPPDWDMIHWGWNFDMFVSYELLPGVSDCLALFQQDRLRLNVETFQKQTIAPRAYRLQYLLGTPCYAISPKGARILRDKLLPFRPKRFPSPQGFPGKIRPSFVVGGVDFALNTLYQTEINAFVCLPPLVITKNDHVASTTRNAQ